MFDAPELARTLDEAQRNCVAVPQLDHNLGVEEAYAIQAALIERRLARGERRVGVKMGFTSRAKMAQMNVNDMIWGRLTDAMILEEGAPLDLGKFIHPRIEPELAFLLKAPLAGDVTAMEAHAAIDGIAPAMEVIDSRYENFRFSLASVVADNASSSGLVVGAWNRPTQDFANLGMVLSFDGKPVQIGSSAAILGHPLRALVAAARLVSQAGEQLSPGDIVMAGAATSAEALRPKSHVRLEVQRLGSIDLLVNAS